MNDKLYYYKAYVTKVYDGDTITVDISLGLKIQTQGEKIRLARINAPEMRGSEKIDGKYSRDYLRDRVLDKDIFIETVKDRTGKYGRYLGEVWLEDDGELININDELVSHGFAVYKDY